MHCRFVAPPIAVGDARAQGTIALGTFTLSCEIGRAVEGPNATYKYERCALCVCRQKAFCGGVESALW